MLIAISTQVLRGLEPTNLGVHVEHLMSLKVLPFTVSVVEQEAILEHKKPANNAQLSLHDKRKSCNILDKLSGQFFLYKYVIWMVMFSDLIKVMYNCIYNVGQLGQISVHYIPVRFIFYNLLMFLLLF